MAQARGSGERRNQHQNQTQNQNHQNEPQNHCYQTTTTTTSTRVSYTSISCLSHRNNASLIPPSTLCLSQAACAFCSLPLLEQTATHHHVSDLPSPNLSLTLDFGPTAPLPELSQSLRRH